MRNQAIKELANKFIMVATMKSVDEGGLSSTSIFKTKTNSLSAVNVNSIFDSQKITFTKWNEESNSFSLFYKEMKTIELSVNSRINGEAAIPTSDDYIHIEIILNNEESYVFETLQYDEVVVWCKMLSNFNILVRDESGIVNLLKTYHGLSMNAFLKNHANEFHENSKSIHFKTDYLR